MTKSEAQTRRLIIDQRLKLSGWEVKNPAHCTEELDIGLAYQQEFGNRSHPIKDIYLLTIVYLAKTENL